MNNYLIAYPDEERAMMELEPFGYAVNVTGPEGETGGEIVYAWNQGTAMVGGTSVILDYKSGVPTLAPGFWVSLLSDAPDEQLWEQMSANYPAIEFGRPGEVSEPPLPSDYVVRSANLTFNIDEIKGISPIWAGMPDVGWSYDG